MAKLYKVNKYTIEQNDKGKYTCTCPAFAFGHGKKCKHITEVVNSGDKYLAQAEPDAPTEDGVNLTFVKAFMRLSNACPTNWEVFQTKQSPVGAGVRDPKKPETSYVYISTFDIKPFVGYRVDFVNIPAGNFSYDIFAEFEKLGLNIYIPPSTVSLPMVSLMPLLPTRKGAISGSILLRTAAESGAAWHWAGICEMEKQKLSFISAKLDTLKTGFTDVKYNYVEESLDGILRDLEFLTARIKQLKTELKVE